MGQHDLWVEAGAVPIQRDVVRVAGPEALEYLQGQLSQELATLPAGGSAWSLVLQPTGKVDAWLRVTRAGDDELHLDVDAGFGEALEARLRRFKLRTKVDIDLASWHGYAVRGPGSSSASARLAGGRALPITWPGTEGLDVFDLDEAPSGLPVVDRGALEALRVERGVPAMGTELTEATIPAEAGDWLIEASVSFTKGCYTGQELVARIDSRGGQVPRPIRGLQLRDDPVAVGATVVHEDKVVGTVTSVATSAALGPIALAPVARSVDPGCEVQVGEHGAARAVVVQLPFR